MKKLTFIVIVPIFFLSSCFLSKKTTENTTDSIIVAFYNVENLFDIVDDPTNPGDDEYTPTSEKNWNEERYNTKLSHLSEVISKIDSTNLPAILGICEVENRKVVEDLTNTKILASGNYGIVHEDSPDHRGIDVAMIYRKDIFNYISHKTYELTLDDDTSFTTREMLYVKGNINKDTFHLFINHWPSRRGGQEESEFKRVKAAQNLRNVVDSIFKINENANIIIMGDMNDEPQNKSLSETLNAKNSKPLNSTELYNLMYNQDLKDIGTYSYKGNWNMLDNLVVSKNLLDGNSTLKVDYEGGIIFKEDFFLYYNTKIDEKTPSRTYGGNNYYGGYSDHLPVYFILHK